MNLEDLKRILLSFADNQNDLIFNKGQLLAVIRGETIDIKVSTHDGTLYVEEHGIAEKALTWVGNRLACLHLLSDRILDYVPKPENFVTPSGSFLNDIEVDPEENNVFVKSASDSLINKLNHPLFGTTNVVYLTSDAGEGKTTLIDELSRKQAEDFKNKKTTWLLVPIPLGGRPFLRFDDIVIASLVNRLRFRLFYYDSFIELVKLGLIIPAFDGFEEMFMESSTGEALSATGGLMNKLESSGSIIIAARKAYFDYKSLSSQAKLFDSIGRNSVSFSKMAINRWEKEKFLQYAGGRLVDDPEGLYDILEKKLGDRHPLLTRPVLIKQLLDVVNSSEDLELLSESLESTSMYFPKFVEAIIKREAETKWIDRSGEPNKPILTTEQHYELLSFVAEEMWLNNTDSLQEGVLDLIAELYCDSNKFSVQVNRQVKERLKQHALIVKASDTNQYKFDHEEFTDFFLGVSIVNKFFTKNILEIKNILRKAVISQQTASTIVAYLVEKESDFNSYLQILAETQKGEGQTSFIRENNGKITLGLLNNQGTATTTVENCVFSTDSLVGVNISGVNFKNCYFQSTTLTGTILSNCKFENCTFDRIEFSKQNRIEDCLLLDCHVENVQNTNNDTEYYDPLHIKMELSNNGFILDKNNDNSDLGDVPEADEELEVVEKALRRFLRATQVNDTIFRLRLGPKADFFFKEIIPQLIDKNLLIEADASGRRSSVKRSFRLGVPFEKINRALTLADGSFTKFLSLASGSE